MISKYPNVENSWDRHCTTDVMSTWWTSSSDLNINVESLQALCLLIECQTPNNVGWESGASSLLNFSSQVGVVLLILSFFINMKGLQALCLWMECPILTNVGWETGASILFEFLAAKLHLFPLCVEHLCWRFCSFAFLFSHSDFKFFSASWFVQIVMPLDWVLSTTEAVESLCYLERRSFRYEERERSTTHA